MLSRVATMNYRLSATHSTLSPLCMSARFAGSLAGSGADAAPHPKTAAERLDLSHMMPHPVWGDDAMKLQHTHKKPHGLTDRAALATIKTLRWTFDVATGFNSGTRSEGMWLRRMMFLETVAGVPGMVGAMQRHLMSLRKMERDYGWIHTLLEEAENERMHLLIALALRSPGPLFRGAVLATQGVFFTWYNVMYLLSPKYCHRLVGYLEEEAIHTYTTLLREIDDPAKLPGFEGVEAPSIAIDYYRLPEGKTSLKDMFLCIRADEGHHRDVNHTFADMGATHKNPFKPGHQGEPASGPWKVGETEVVQPQ